MTQNNNFIVRDFIYLDGDRLYSLYSQIFEGVAEGVVDSYLDRLTSKNEQKGTPLLGRQAEQEVTTENQRLENKILHDHLYNRLEKKIVNAIIKPDQLSPENYEETLKNAFMIKITGQAEIEDYEKIRGLITEWNKLFDNVLSLNTEYRDLTDQIQQLKEQAKNIKDRNKKSVATQQIKKSEDKLRELSSKKFDDKLISSIGYLIEKFFKDNFSITILSEKGDAKISFRGMLDKKWLRVAPEYLASLYGTGMDWNLTMVGQITYLPRQNVNLRTQSTPKEKMSKAGMRGAFQEIFKMYQNVELALVENNRVSEVGIWPIAIYRETKIPSIAQE